MGKCASENRFIALPLQARPPHVIELRGVDAIIAREANKDGERDRFDGAEGEAS